MDASLPPNVRRHGRGFRAVYTDRGLGLRRYGPTFPAPEKAAAWLADLRAVESGDALTIGAAGQMLLADLRLHAREATLVFYLGQLKALQRSWPDHTPLAVIGRAAILAHIEAQRARGVSMTTIVTKGLSTLRRLICVCGESRHPMRLRVHPMRLQPLIDRDDGEREAAVRQAVGRRKAAVRGPEPQRARGNAQRLGDLGNRHERGEGHGVKRKSPGAATRHRGRHIAAPGRPATRRPLRMGKGGARPHSSAHRGSAMHTRCGPLTGGSAPPMTARLAEDEKSRAPGVRARGQPAEETAAGVGGREVAPRRTIGNGAAMSERGGRQRATGAARRTAPTVWGSRAPLHGLVI